MHCASSDPRFIGAVLSFMGVRRIMLRSHFCIEVVCKRKLKKKSGGAAKKWE